MFEDASRYASSRFSEVQVFNALITRKEPGRPLQPLSDEIAILRGLFFVHLYGAFEASIRRGLLTFVQQFNTRKFLLCHLRLELHAMACGPQFDSLSGRRASWKERQVLLTRMQSDEQAFIHEGVLQQDLSNARCAVLRSLFHSLAITSPITPDPSFEGYIEEVVEKRNQVAHGRETPAIIGRSATPADRAKRIWALQTTSYHVIDVFAEHLASNACVVDHHRAGYTNGG